MSNITAQGYGPQRITNLIAQGSLCVAIALTVLLVAYDLLHGTLMKTRFWIACGTIVYLVFVTYLARRGRIQLANWLIIVLYEVLAIVVLTYWGLTSTMGMLTAIFALILPGVLMTPRAIFPVAIIAMGVLIFAHYLHATGAVTPVPNTAPASSSILDIIAYTIIIGVFALVSWISARQSALGLNRALKAEEGLRKQKELLAVELERESSRLRHTQLQQIQQLYRFAVIGQSATATLHELSNHLSVLNLDIGDIKQQHRRSKAITSAEDSIEYINRMVRKARTQLNAQDKAKTFNALLTINRVVKDFHPKFQQRCIKLIKSGPKRGTSFPIHGDPLSLMQCLSILLNNALDACSDIPYARVRLTVSINEGLLSLTISDTGPGISADVQQALFQPLESSKPSGLGVGLYIAKHLIESRFKGTLKHIETNTGATFQITIKRHSS